MSHGFSQEQWSDLESPLGSAPSTFPQLQLMGLHSLHTEGWQAIKCLVIMICAVWWIQKLGSKWWADCKTSSFLPWVVKMETSHTCSAEQLSMVSLDLPHAASPHLQVHVIHVFLSPRAHLDRQAVALLKHPSAVCGESHDSPGLRYLTDHTCVL